MYDKTGNYYTEVIEICWPENLITKLREQYNGHNIFQFFANTTVTLLLFKLYIAYFYAFIKQLIC